MSETSVKDVQIGGMVANIQGYTTDPYFDRIQQHVDALSPLYAVGSAACRPDGVIMDIGANIGASGIMLSYIIPAGRLYCVEPSPKNLALLRRNMSENVRIQHEVLPYALGAGRGSVTFHESGVCGAWNHVTPNTCLGSGDPTGRVEQTSVDALTASFTRLDLIKIDVEGYETEILKGMRRTVRRLSPVVQMEINTVTTILIADRSPRALLRDFIALMGNAYAFADGGKLTPLDTDDAQATFLFKNLTEHGCIDDVVGCRDPERLRALIA